MTMPDLWTLLSAPLVERLGWVLLHFVWQGALVAAGLAGGLYLLRGRAPTVRYAVSCAALVGLLALPIGTGLFLGDFLLESDSASTALVVATESAADVATVPSSAVVEPTAPAPSLRTRVMTWLQPALPWLVLGWAVGVLLFSVRLAGGAWRVRRLRRESTPAPSRWRDRLMALADRLGLRHAVALRVSDHVDSPMVAGWWRPVVLVPVGLLSGLPPDQVEALLLHELAHVRRHDVLVGRLQAVVEALLFFHPATWWISGQVRQTREACCDDLTVEAANRTVYARALAALAERTHATPRPAGALAASDGALLARIRRVLDPSATPSKSARRLSMAVALLLLVAVPLGVAACASQQSTAEADAAKDAPSSERAETPPRSPRAPEAEPEGPTVVVVQDDSVRRVVTVRGAEAVEVDSLDDGGYVLRYEGERIDTLDVPDPKVLVEPDSVEEEVRLSLDPDSLERRVRGLRLHSDSLERVILGHVNPDSIERIIQARFDPDSLKHLLRERFDLDSLEHQALRVRWRADSLSRTFDEHFFENHPHLADSTFVFDRDAFDRGEFNFDADIDSLLRQYEDADLDSLFSQRQLHADSLRRHLEDLRERARRRMEDLREQWKRGMPEQLRDQARRLREQAERLEERAREIEAPPSPDEPDDPEPTSDAAQTGEPQFAVEDLQASVDGQVVQNGGVTLRGNGFFWMRGRDAFYLFAAQSFEEGRRVGEFRGRSLAITVGGRDVTLHSNAHRPLYSEEGAPVYATRIPLEEASNTVPACPFDSDAGVGDDLRRFVDRCVAS